MGNAMRRVGTALICAAAMSSSLAAQYAQDRQTTEALLEEFVRSGLSRQLELANRIVSLHDATVLARLERRLIDQDRHVRANVAFVFAAMGDPRGFEVIAGILDDRSDRSEGQGVPGARWSVAQQIRADRYYAVNVLARLRDERVVDLLLPLLKDPDVNYEAAWALGEVGEARAIAPLIETLRTDNALVRISAIDALVKLNAKTAVPHFRALLDDHRLPSAGDRVTVADTAKKGIQLLGAASLETNQQMPPELITLVERARLKGPVTAWCRAEFHSGHPGAFALGVASVAGGRYVALDADGTVTELAAFKRSADLSCYSRAQAEEIDVTIRRSDTIHGRIAPRWNATVVCGFIDETAAECWQYSPADRAFVRVGQWIT